MAWSSTGIGRRVSFNHRAVETRESVVVDRKTHIYTVDGSRKPSVTDILADAGISNNSAFIPESARVRGTRVHRVIAEIETIGASPSLGNYRELAGYVDAYLEWRESAGLGNPQYVEQSFYRPDLDYCGTPDQVWTEAHHTIVDFKSGSPSVADAVQLTGYADLLLWATNKTAKDIQKISVYLDSTGKFQTARRVHEDIWYSAARLCNWKRQSGVWKWPE